MNKKNVQEQVENKPKRLGEELFNKKLGLDKRMKNNNRVTITALILMFVICCIFYAEKRSAENEKSKSVYISENGSTPYRVFYKTSVEENRPIEAKDFIITFTKLVFTIPPSAEKITSNFKKAILYGDSSIIQVYNLFNNRGFFTDVVRNGILYKPQIYFDNINIEQKNNYFLVQYKFDLLGDAGSKVQKLEMGGLMQLYPTLRTEENPHGFYIRGFRVSILTNTVTNKTEMNEDLPE